MGSGVQAVGIRQPYRLVRQPKTVGDLVVAIPSAYLGNRIAANTDWQRLLCGQCCVAMAAHCSLLDAILATSCIGATTRGDICNGLVNLGVKFSTIGPPTPPFLVRLISKFNVNTSHWMLVIGEEPQHDFVVETWKVLNPQADFQQRWPKTTIQTNNNNYINLL